MAGAEPTEGKRDGGGPIRRVLACLDGSDLAERVLPHAYAAAIALAAPITLLRVLEHHARGDQPPADPMEWEIQRKEAHGYLERLAQSSPARAAAAETEVIEGKAAEEICRWSGRHGVDLTVASTHGAGGHSPWPLASTARKLLDRAPGSVLLVPARLEAPAEVRYRRVLVPLDGSPQAETAFPIAARIASAHEAELVLVHVVPVPELTENGPPDAEDVELRDRLVRRNERVARLYLDRVRARLSEDVREVRLLLLQGGDVAGRVARAADDEQVDLIVMSAHGRGAHPGAPCGGATASLIARSAVPLLVVRSDGRRAMRPASASDKEAVRLPRLAAP